MTKEGKWRPIRPIVMALFLTASFGRATEHHDVFQLKEPNGNVLFNDKDLACVWVKQGTTNLLLQHYAAKAFEDYTGKHIGQPLILTVCGKEQSILIKVPIPSGVIYPGQLSEDQEACLRNSLKLSKSWSECPLCK